MIVLSLAVLQQPWLFAWFRGSYGGIQFGGADTKVTLMCFGITLLYKWGLSLCPQPLRHERSITLIFPFTRIGSILTSVLSCLTKTAALSSQLLESKFADFCKMIYCTSLRRLAGLGRPEKASKRYCSQRFTSRLGMETLGRGLYVNYHNYRPHAALEMHCEGSLISSLEPEHHQLQPRLQEVLDSRHTKLNECRLPSLNLSFLPYTMDYLRKSGKSLSKSRTNTT